MPRAVVVTKLDHARADYAGSARRGAGVVRERRRQGAAAVRRRSCPAPRSPPGGAARPGASPSEHAEDRNALIEGIIEESEDEGLMDRYLSGEQVTEAALLEDLHRAMARGTFFPVVPALLRPAGGLRELLDLMVRGLPGPVGAPAARGVHPRGQAHRPGHLRPRRPAAGRGRQDRQRPLRREGQPGPGVLRLARRRPAGARLRAPHVVLRRGRRPPGPRRRRAGRLAVPPVRPAPCPRQAGGRRRHRVGRRLTRAETGDTLSSVDDPRVLRPWSLPTPLLPVAIEAATRSDEDKLSTALGRLAAEDPSLRVEISSEPQLVLWTMGEAHPTPRWSGCATGSACRSTGRVRCPCARRSPARAKALGRHVKQSGGHGQYAVCEIEVEPLPGGLGVRVRRAGGRRRRAPAVHPQVEKGVRAQLARGVPRRPPDGRHQGHPDRRQGAQRGLLGHGFPERRALALREAARRRHRRAGAGRRDRGDGPRRPRGHGDERPRGPAGPGARPGHRGRARRASARTCRPPSSSATRSTCARRPTAPAPSPARSPTTSPFPSADSHLCPPPRLDWREGAQMTELSRAMPTFEEFVASRGRDLWRSAWLLTGDAQKAEDLLQTALVEGAGAGGRRSRRTVPSRHTPGARS